MLACSQLFDNQASIIHLASLVAAQQHLAADMPAITSMRADMHTHTKSLAHAKAKTFKLWLGLV